jgi:GntR family transcriptional regulator
VLNLVVDETSLLPAWVQIKEQIKLAYTVGRLNEGDVLPSIRSLARQLRVSDAAVRRAYEELTRLGLLSAEPRKHLVVTDTLAKPDDVKKLAGDVAAECDRMVSWARAQGLSAISVARILLLRAIEKEQALPTYLYVDMSRESASSFADDIAKAWEIPIRGCDLAEAARLASAELQSLTAVLVNSYRYEALRKMLRGYPVERILPVRVRLHRRLIRKLRRLPAGSHALLVLQDEDAAHIGRAVLDYVQGEVGDKVTITTSALRDVPDLAALAEEDRYQLVLVSRHVWWQIPERARRNPRVVPSENELIMESLEKARVRAGVLV